MPVSAEVTAFIGSVSGIALGVAGKILYTRIMSNGNGNDLTNQLQAVPLPQCPDHQRLAAEVKEIRTDMKTGFEDLHKKMNESAKCLASIEGYLEGYIDKVKR